MSAVPSDRFRGSADPALRARSWCEQLAPVFEVQLARDADLSAPLALATFHSGDVLVDSVSAPAQRLERSAQMIARQGIDHILLQFYTAGTSRTDGARREAGVRASQFVVFYLSQPIVTEAAPVSATNIMLPRKLLGDQIATIENRDPRSEDLDAIRHQSRRTVAIASALFSAGEMPSRRQ